MSNIVFYKLYSNIAEIIVSRMITSGRWDKNNLTKAQVENFFDELIELAKARGESRDQLLDTLNAYFRLNR